MTLLTRRELLKTTILLGGTVVTSSALLGACSRDGVKAKLQETAVLSTDDQQLMEEIADTMLPTTPSSPGAKAAAVGPAINLLLTDCYDPASQQRALGGLVAFRTMCQDRCGGAFTKLSPIEREKLLSEIDAEATRLGDAHWFHLMRELSLRAYFSSEIGMTKALRYVRVPGRFTGCMPLAPGQPAWG
ncbi:MAG: gluconate 2-dehydrogenase subunit 3 family protein [Gemmatimonadaceae bacterium]